MQHHNSRARKGGFTLVEIIVVLVIVALISSIVFSAFKSVREGNKKTSCQGNMVQIYQALRLYGQDYSGELPSYNPAGTVAGRAPNGLGLWALYAYPASSALDCDGRTTQLPTTEPANNNAPPLASYVRSPKIFHCPYDDYDHAPTPSPGCNMDATANLNSSQMTFTDKANLVRFNPYYNSYQTLDDLPTTGGPLDKATYSSFRNPGASRQIVYWETASPNNIINAKRRTPDTTILFWCRFHRKLDKTGSTADPTNLSNSDNVLFMDGTVQYLPTRQDIGTSTGANACQAWTRAPLEAAGSLTSCPNGS